MSFATRSIEFTSCIPSSLPVRLLRNGAREIRRSLLRSPPAAATVAVTVCFGGVGYVAYKAAVHYRAPIASAFKRATSMVPRFSRSTPAGTTDSPVIDGEAEVL